MTYRTWELKGNVLCLNDSRTTTSSCLMLDGDQLAVVQHLINVVGMPYYDDKGVLHPGWKEAKQ